MRRTVEGFDGSLSIDRKRGPWPRFFFPALLLPMQIPMNDPFARAAALATDPRSAAQAARVPVRDSRAIRARLILASALRRLGQVPEPCLC
jgi:hypothetical protein